ncbi:MAG: hypothetical protein AMJ65_09975 [Phycisphaerae bacterium SG8_4]|nr:MAG: hypothetical protein AMJ65_09975 [Phycisphaerae bacterium SG8_4]
MSDWEVNKPLGQCSGSGRRIEHGEEYFGALVMVEEGLQRQDFCAEYWESEKPDVFCHWKTKLPEPGHRKQLFVDDQMLMAFFERLARETDPEKINFRFVLTLVLMRKRLLKYHESRTEDGKEIWRLRMPGDKSAELVEVVNPHLDAEQIEQLSSQMGEILHTDL